MLQVQYAASNSRGILASLIGWIDFGTILSLTQYSPSTTITNAIAGGYLISFELTLSLQGSSCATSQVRFAGTTVPTTPTSPFGNAAYTGIPGNVALYMETNPPLNNDIDVTISMRNISVTNIFGEPFYNYFIVAADNEFTSQCCNASPETWSITTNGSPWELVEEIPSVVDSVTGAPVVSGIDTRTVTETGVASNPERTAANVFLTEGPSELIARSSVDGSRQGFSIGIIIPKQKCCNALSLVRPSHINYVNPPHCDVFTLPLKSCEILTSIVDPCTTFPVNDAPILIHGRLGSYLFFNNCVLFSGLCGCPKNVFDIFTLVIKKDNECIFKYLIFAPRSSLPRY